MRGLQIFIGLVLAFYMPSFAYAQESSNTIAGYLVSDNSYGDSPPSLDVTPIYHDRQQRIQDIYTGMDFNPEDFSLKFTDYPYGNQNVDLKMIVEYGVALADEGPHVELLDWKMCDGASYILENVRETYTFRKDKGDVEKPCMVSFEKDELMHAIANRSDYPSHTEDIKRWQDVAERCYHGDDFSCITALSYRFEFVVKDPERADQTYKLKPFRIVPPNGC